MIVADAVPVWNSQSHSVGTHWQSVGEPHDAIFTVSDELSLELITDKMTVKCVTTIPCIDPADLSINISD